MKDNIDLHILRMNFIEFLTSFLEGEVKLSVVLQVNERIYQRDPTSLSLIFIQVTKDLHNLKERVDHGELIDKDTINNTISDSILRLIDD